MTPEDICDGVPFAVSADRPEPELMTLILAYAMQCPRCDATAMTWWLWRGSLVHVDPARLRDALQ